MSDDEKCDVALRGNGCRLGFDDGAEGARGVSVVIDAGGEDVIGVEVGGMDVQRTDTQRQHEGAENEGGNGP